MYKHSMDSGLYNKWVSYRRHLWGIWKNWNTKCLSGIVAFLVIFLCNDISGYINAILRGMLKQGGGNEGCVTYFQMIQLN